jgi:hypothetical protein
MESLPEDNIDGVNFLTVFNDKLVIKTDRTQQYDDLVKNIFIGLSPILLIFLIVSIFSLSGVILLIIFTVGPLAVVSVHLYYRYSKYELILDKYIEKIYLKRISPSFKRRRSYDLDNIDSIIYQRGNYVFGTLYDVNFSLKDKKDSKTIYTGVKYNSGRVAKIIAEFLGIPLNYDDSKEVKIYWE